MEAVFAAFVAGLLGGVHCAGMCGGIAGALSGNARGAPWRRLFAFNAGRIASYAAAGAAAGSLGRIIAMPGSLQTARVILFVIAQLMLIMLGLYIAGWSGFFIRLEKFGGAFWKRLEPLRRRVVPIDSDGKALAAGVLWGWVPCGLVYGMLPFAIAGGDALRGALILAAFGVGTLPSVLIAGTAGLRFGQFRRNRWVRRGAGTAVIVLAAFSLTHLSMSASAMAAGH